MFLEIIIQYSRYGYINWCEPHNPDLFHPKFYARPYKDMPYLLFKKLYIFSNEEKPNSLVAIFWAKPVPIFSLCLAWIMQVRLTPSGPTPFQTAVLPCLLIPNLRQIFSMSSQVNVYPINLSSPCLTALTGRSFPCFPRSEGYAVNTNNVHDGHQIYLNKREGR